MYETRHFPSMLSGLTLFLQSHSLHRSAHQEADLDFVELPILLWEEVLLAVTKVAERPSRVHVEQNRQELAPGDLVVEVVLLLLVTLEGFNYQVGTIPDTGGNGLGEEKLPRIVYTRLELDLKGLVELDAGVKQIRVAGGRLAWDEEQVGRNSVGANLAQRLGSSAPSSGNQ